MNKQALIRMYNGNTHTVEEILTLWAGKTVHITDSLFLTIEEMVEHTIQTGSFNPSDLGGHAWGLSMELVSMPEEVETKDAQTSLFYNDLYIAHEEGTKLCQDHALLLDFVDHGHLLLSVVSDTRISELLEGFFMFTLESLLDIAKLRTQVRRLDPNENYGLIKSNIDIYRLFNEFTKK